MKNRFEQEQHNTQDTQLRRRTFLRNMAMGAAGGSIMFVGADRSLAGSKDIGEVVLDGLMWTYVAAPLGTTGSHFLTPETNYSITIRLNTQEESVSLKARVAMGNEHLNGHVNQIESTRIRDAIALFPRSSKNESFSVGSLGGIPEDTSFFGLCRPILRIKGDGDKARFRLIDAECILSTSARQLADPQDGFLSSDTASSWLSQYVSDTARLTEPRFVLVETLDGGQHTLTRRGRNEPPVVFASITSRVLDQTGFTSDVFKQAFAVGSNLGITYFSAQDSRGRLLTSTLDLKGGTGPNRIYWDRVFKTFVIAQ